MSSNEESTVFCIRFVSLSIGRWKPGQVDEDELVVLAVRDAVDPATGRVRHRRGDRDLLADERVHERRLADVRPARDGDEPGFHVSGKSQVSGSSSSAA